LPTANGNTRYRKVNPMSLLFKLSLVCCVAFQWDSFSLPELKAFLCILDREEESYRYQVQLKYGAKKRAAEMRLKRLADDKTSSA